MEYMRIGELASLAGVSPRTIDYYTQIGLIHEEKRSPGKHRLYAAEALKSIRIIKELQKQHYTLDEISCLFREKSGADDTILEKIVGLQKRLDRLQKEIVEIYPSLQLEGQNRQLQAVSRELATKGMSVMQVLLLLLGEPTM